MHHSHAIDDRELRMFESATQAEIRRRWVLTWAGIALTVAAWSSGIALVVLGYDRWAASALIFAGAGMTAAGALSRKAPAAATVSSPAPAPAPGP